MHLPLLLVVLTRNESMGRRFLPESPRTTIPLCARRVLRPSSASASSRSLSQNTTGVLRVNGSSSTNTSNRIVTTRVVGSVQFKSTLNMFTPCEKFEIIRWQYAEYVRVVS